MRPVIWKDNTVEMIDQRLLPTEEVWLSYNDAAGVAEAILTMVVRGAPAIGIAAAYGLALETLRFEGEPGEQWTMFFLDPFGNPIEVKGFRSLDTIYDKQ